MHIVTDGKSWSGCILVQPLEWNRNEDAFYRSPLWYIYIYGLRNRHTAVSTQCIVLFVKKKRKKEGAFESPKSMTMIGMSAAALCPEVCISDTNKASGGTEVPNTSGANPFVFLSMT